MSKVNSSPSMSESPQNPKLPVTGAPVSFRNPFEERDSDEVWRELLENAGPPISREEAMKRMVEADKERRTKE
ncbi:hypothetical protein [Hymenobacter montanus]|uniref:hypothetical protein n=1 Tax=Hymenobacter montanus TaxID=2771359 RepID=UPI001CC3079C|nr:hypothetical protein [Hymenobacter montanus]